MQIHEKGKMNDNTIKVESLHISSAILSEDKTDVYRHAAIRMFLPTGVQLSNEEYAHQVGEAVAQYLLNNISLRSRDMDDTGKSNKETAGEVFNEGKWDNLKWYSVGEI